MQPGNAKGNRKHMEKDRHVKNHAAKMPSLSRKRGRSNFSFNRRDEEKGGSDRRGSASEKGGGGDRIVPARPALKKKNRTKKTLVHDRKTFVGLGEEITTLRGRRYMNPEQ